MLRRRTKTIIAVGIGVALLAMTTWINSVAAQSVSTSGPPGSWESMVRINAGGGQYTDSRGLTWSADAGFVGGSVHSVTNPINGTRDPDLFQSERWGMTGYNIPISNGSYVLKLYFAEINPSSGSRSINVSAGNTQLLKDFSVAEKVGDYTADAETFNVTVTNGVLPLTFSADSNSTSVAGIEVLKVDAYSVYRMNAGGGSYTDTRGLTWSADSGETGNAGTSHTTADAIDGTDNPGLYQDQRVGMGGYKVDIVNGTYILKLYFANTGLSNGTFNILNGTNPLRENFAIAGNDKVDVEQFVVNVTDGTLSLNFTADTGQPSIAAIELLSPVTSNSQSPSQAADNVVKRSASSSSTTVTTTSVPVSVTEPIVPTDDTTTSSSLTPSMDGWKMVASDDFNGNSLSGQWGTYSGPGNEGVGTRSPSALSVSNGELDITDQGSVGGGAAFDYSSIYGRYVIRAKDDVGTGYGPAILLWPDSEKWPQDGEIDITEMPEGARNLSHFTVHYGADNSQVGYTTSGDFTQWHTWTLDWMPDHITLWIDGALQSTITTAAAIPHDSMHLAVQNDVGADGHWIPARTASTPATVTLHIDSVQVYQQN